MEKYVSNRELSEKLQKLGVIQESWLYWHKCGGYRKWELTRIKSDIECYSAFTIGELGEMLPNKIEVDNGKLVMLDKGKTVIYTQHIGHRFEWLYFKIADTEANARAKMLIYLIEQKLMGVGK